MNTKIVSMPTINNHKLIVNVCKNWFQKIVHSMMRLEMFN